LLFVKISHIFLIEVESDNDRHVKSKKINHAVYSPANLILNDKILKKIIKQLTNKTPT
jgi:hypothetical protein